jgi:K+-transporting ATPase ATPase B chain
LLITSESAKYIAIVPTAFVATLPYHFSTKIFAFTSIERAILAIIIFSSLLMLTMMPLVSWGMRLPPAAGTAQFLRNLLCYGVGGVILRVAGIGLAALVIGAVGPSSSDVPQRSPAEHRGARGHCSAVTGLDQLI